MSEEAIEEVQTEATDGGVEAEANLSGGIDVKVDTTDVTPEEDKDPLARVKEKYGNDIDKLAEAYRNAEKKISAGQYEAPEAPEKYDYNFEVEGLDADLISPDDPLLAKMTDVFRENKLPQDTADQLVNAFLEYEMSQQPKMEDELAKLGGEGNDIMERLTNFSQKHLEENEQELFDSMTLSADHISLLNKMVGMMGEQNVADVTQFQDAGKSAQEYIDEAFDYRAKYADTIGWNKEQQKHYEGLIAKANKAKK